jgi:hypothetical protein
MGVKIGKKMYISGTPSGPLIEGGRVGEELKVLGGFLVGESGERRAGRAREKGGVVGVERWCFSLRESWLWVKMGEWGELDIWARGPPISTLLP